LGDTIEGCSPNWGRERRKERCVIPPKDPKARGKVLKKSRVEGEKLRGQERAAAG